MKTVFLFFLISLSLHISSAHTFELEEFSGEKIRLDDKIGQGRWSLVMFWAHHCGVCKVEMPIFSEFHTRRDDVDVIGISIDGPEDKHLAVDFLESYQPSFSSYLSSLTIVAANYQAITEEEFRGTPTFLLFTPHGELIGNNPGKMSIDALEKFIDRNS
ncbi:MAG: TlpA family protein disulfide reductase [Acidiferrobacterales bacterium]|nr:TlpA family protein disulfide reductase [Acidiferrobacterales bacterium]